MCSSTSYSYSFFFFLFCFVSNLFKSPSWKSGCIYNSRKGSTTQT